MILRQQAVLAGVAVAALVSCAPAAPVSSAVTAPAANVVALRNPGFELPPRPAERCAPHWDCSMHADTESFKFHLDTSSPAAGQYSLCIERVKAEPWALATQGLASEPLRGKRLRFSLAIRADKIDGRAGPWVLIQGVPPAQGHFERLVPRTDGWQRVAVEFTVPPEGTIMAIGATLEGGGRACIDEARLEILAPG